MKRRIAYAIPDLMKRLLVSIGAAFALGGACLADTPFNTPGNFNPIVPGYFADPTVEKFGDTFYLYATTDGNGGGRGPATVWVSRDFVNWVLVPMNWPTTPFYWAPDVVKRPDGRYYLYYNQPCNTYGAHSDSPLGAWTPLIRDDGLVIPDRLVKDVITLQLERLAGQRHLDAIGKQRTPIFLQLISASCRGCCGGDDARLPQGRKSCCQYT